MSCYGAERRGLFRAPATQTCSTSVYVGIGALCICRGRVGKYTMSRKNGPGEAGRATFLCKIIVNRKLAGAANHGPCRKLKWPYLTPTRPAYQAVSAPLEIAPWARAACRTYLCAFLASCERDGASKNRSSLQAFATSQTHRESFRSQLR